MLRSPWHLAFVLTASLNMLSIALGAADGQQLNNPFGIMTRLHSGSFDSTGGCRYMQLARDLVGEWGYVRQSVDTATMDMRTVKKILIICRAKHLIPIATGGKLPPQYTAGRYPKRDADGTYRTAVQWLARWLANLRNDGFKLPFFELGNEVNLYWEAADYARWLLDVAQALKAVDPEIKVMTAGMAGSGWKFIDQMLQAQPRLKAWVDIWAIHPYGANHPPSYNQDDTTLRGFEWTLRILNKHGIYAPLVFTETGYELGCALDRRYPPITEELRARYMVEAFQKYWRPHPRILAVTPFELWDINWNGWSGWDWIRSDGTKTPVYKAIAALKKPQGRDYLPIGNCSVRGRIVDEEYGIGVPHVLVWLQPGPYAAESDGNGWFNITNVPAGEYQISALRDGFLITRAGANGVLKVVRNGMPFEWYDRIILRNGESARWDAQMRHVGLLIGTFEAGSGTGRIADGWQTATGEVDPNIYALDREVKRSGIASQCIRAQGDGRRAELWRVGDYMSAWIGKIYIARIWVRTSGLVCGKNAGVQFAFEIADSFGVPCATALVSTKGAKEWTPLTAVLRCPSDGRRVRVTLSVDAKRGMVWFDDLFVGEANFPLPRSWWRFSEREHIASRNRSIIQGTVRDWRGMPVDGATVMLEPGAFWAVSNKRGQFKLQAPIGNYTLYAFAAEQPTLKVNLSISRDEVEQLQLKFPMPSYPHTIRNADFEEPGIESAYVPGWKRWGSTDGIVSSGRWLFGVKAYSGKHFFAAGANANTKNGGIYQTISVKPGAKYEVSTWHLTIQRGGTPEDVTNRLGVDPTGGRNPYADTVLWTPYQHSFEKWKRLSLKVVARAPAITIFLEHRQRQGIQWSANAFDCVSIRRIAHQAGAGLKSASGNPRLSR